MKKMYLVALVAIFSLTAVKAQEGLNVGAHIGFPVGDASDSVGFNFGIDASYLVEVADGFFAGGATGFTNFAGKSNATILGQSFNSPSQGFIPIAATGRYAFSDQIFGALDLGYAIATRSGGSGGFYLQPKVGYTINDPMDVYIAFKSIDGNGAFGAGFTYRFDI